MIKPQAPFYTETADSPGPDDTFASYGQPIERGRPPIFPDFALCTYSRTPHSDILHIVVEVKRSEVSFHQACSDIGDYLDSQGGISPNAFGIAIAGSEVGILEMGSEEVVKRFDLNDEEFILFLKDYWRQQE
jgi:hypothetical protein